MANIIEIVLKGTNKIDKAFTAPVTGIADGFEKVATAAKLAAAAAAGVLVALTKAAIDNADEMGRAAKVAGLSVQEFSKLATAARLSDTSIETLSGGIAGLNKHLVEAARNADSEAAKAFEAMGVSITGADGKLRSASQVLLAVSAKFAGYADGAEKSALAAAIFGKSAGPELVPMLNQGKAAIEQMMAEATGVTAEAAEQANQYNDNLTVLKLQIAEVGKSLAAELLPWLVKVTDELIYFIQTNGIAQGVARTAIDIFKGFAFAVVGLYTGLRIMAEVLAGAWAASMAFGAANLKTAINLFTIWGKGVVEMVKSLWSLVKAVGEVGTVLGFLSEGDFQGAWEASQAAVGRFGEELTHMGDTFKGVLADSKKAVVENYTEAWETAKLSTHAAIDSIKKEAQSLDSFIMKLYGPANITVPDRKPGGAPSSAPVTSGKNASDQEQLALKQIELMERQRDVMATLHAEGLRGAEAMIAAENIRYQNQLEQIDQAGFAEEEFYAARQLAFENHQLALTEMFSQGLAARAELEQIFNEARIESLLAFHETEQAAEQANLEARQGLMQTLHDMWSNSFFAPMQANMTNFVNTTMQTFAQSAAAAMTNLITGAQTASQAFGQLGKAMLGAVVGFFTQLIANTIAYALISAIIGTSMISAAMTALSPLLAMNTANATAAAIGTFGGATSAAAGVPLAMALNVGFAKTLAFGGVAHGGIDMVPGVGDQTWVVKGGERIVQGPANEDLTNFLDSQADEGRGRPINLTMEIDGREFFSLLFDATRDGRFRISQGAIVT
ncbi:MAG: hypothetical protein AB1705_14565 [Verrucomicrobiota bacterium]